MTISMLRVGLKLFDFACNTDTLERVLRPLAEAIDEAGKTVDSYGDEELEFRLDDELDAVENLLGIAYVMCQTHMNGVLGRAVAMNGHLIRHPPSQLLLGATEPPTVLLQRCGQAEIGPHTKAWMLWNLANYFKHRDEWPPDWANAPKSAKTTIAVIAAAGLEAGSSGNLRTGASALGLDAYQHLDMLIDEVSDWSGSVRDYIKANLAIP